MHESLFESRLLIRIATMQYLFKIFLNYWWIRFITSNKSERYMSWSYMKFSCFDIQNKKEQLKLELQKICLIQNLFRVYFMCLTLTITVTQFASANHVIVMKELTSLFAFFLLIIITSKQLVNWHYLVMTHSRLSVSKIHVLKNF